MLEKGRRTQRRRRRRLTNTLAYRHKHRLTTQGKTEIFFFLTLYTYIFPPMPITNGYESEPICSCCCLWRKNEKEKPTRPFRKWSCSLWGNVKLIIFPVRDYSDVYLSTMVDYYLSGSIGKSLPSCVFSRLSTLPVVKCHAYKAGLREKKKKKDWRTVGANLIIFLGSRWKMGTEKW